MPQDNQDLFNVMDSALKRQGEGRKQRFRPAGEDRPSSERKVKPPSSRGTSPSPETAAAPEAPAAPAPSVAASTPTGEPTIHIPDYQRMDGQPSTREITRRLYPMPESARILPAGGSLSPGQVLRGTVFSGNSRFRPQPAQQGGPEMQPPPMEELPPTPPAQQAPPPPQATPSGPPSTRQAPARGIASATFRSRPSSLLTPGIRPSGQLVPQAPAMAASNRYEPPPAHVPAGSLYVRTEMAYVALAGTVGMLFGAFFLGHQMGESSAQKKSAAERPKVEKPQPTSTVPRPVTGLDTPPPAGTTPPIQSPQLPVVEPPKVNPPPAGTVPPVATTPTVPASGKYALRVRTYTDKSASEKAEKLASQLRGKQFPDVRVVSVRGACKVLAGHFSSEKDPAIDHLRRQLQANPDWRSFSPEVVKE